MAIKESTKDKSSFFFFPPVNAQVEARAESQWERHNIYQQSKDLILLIFTSSESAALRAFRLVEGEQLHPVSIHQSLTLTVEKAVTQGATCRGRYAGSSWHRNTGGSRKGSNTQLETDLQARSAADFGAECRRWRERQWGEGGGG